VSVHAIYADDELAALYDLFYYDYDDDVDMHEQFARRADTASLEVGAGTGRLAVRLMERGLDVVALDSAPAMLRRLRARLGGAHADRLRVAEGDVRAFDLGERFDVIHCAANTFQHLLTRDDQLAALRCIARHLRPGGVFVAKLASVASVDWGGTDGALRLRDTRVDPQTGEAVMRFDAARAIANELRLDRTFVYDRLMADGTLRRRVAETSLRYMAASELQALVEASGLRLAQLYGTYELSPFSEDSDTMIAVAELPS